MSLTKQQVAATISEFASAMGQLGVSDEEAASALGTTPGYIRDVANLRARHIEDPWILRNYLIERADEQGSPRPSFSALVGDYHGYWFLNSRRIERGKLDR